MAPWCAGAPERPRSTFLKVRSNGPASPPGGALGRSASPANLRCQLPLAAAACPGLAEAATQAVQQPLELPGNLHLTDPEFLGKLDL